MCRCDQPVKGFFFDVPKRIQRIARNWSVLSMMLCFFGGKKSILIWCQFTFFPSTEVYIVNLRKKIIGGEIKLGRIRGVFFCVRICVEEMGRGEKGKTEKRQEAFVLYMS